MASSIPHNMYHVVYIFTHLMDIGAASSSGVASMKAGEKLLISFINLPKSSNMSLEWKRDFS